MSERIFTIILMVPTNLYGLSIREHFRVEWEKAETVDEAIKNARVHAAREYVAEQDTSMATFMEPPRQDEFHVVFVGMGWIRNVTPYTS